MLEYLLNFFGLYSQSSKTETFDDSDWEIITYTQIKDDIKQNIQKEPIENKIIKNFFDKQNIIKINNSEVYKYCKNKKSNNVYNEKYKNIPNKKHNIYNIQQPIKSKKMVKSSYSKKK